jgi:hypothetical protein
VGGAFDLRLAPVVGGYFLGDYEGLAASGGVFYPLFVMTTPLLVDPTDVYVQAVAIPTTPAAPAFISAAPQVRFPGRAERFGTRL